MVYTTDKIVFALDILPQLSYPILMKIVINAGYGGFSLSPAAVVRAAQLGLPFETYPYVRDRYNADDQPTDMEDGFTLMGRPGGASLFWSVVKDGMVYGTRPDGPLRAHPALVQTVEELGEAANGSCATLKVVTIPDGVQWEIEEYDGREWVAEQHRTWYAND